MSSLGLRKRGMAVESPTTGRLQITNAGVERVAHLMGISEKQQGDAERFLDDPSLKLKVLDPHILTALIRRFVGMNSQGNFRGKKFLELGCVDHNSAKSSFAVALVKKGARVHGIDFAKPAAGGGDPAVLRNSGLMKRLKLVEGDLLDLDKHFKGVKYDAIVSNDVLESGAVPFLSPEVKSKLLQDIYAKLTPGGFLLSKIRTNPLFSREQLEQAGFRVIIFSRLNDTRKFISRITRPNLFYSDHILVACRIR